MLKNVESKTIGKSLGRKGRPPCFGVLSELKNENDKLEHKRRNWIVPDKLDAKLDIELEASGWIEGDRKPLIGSPESDAN